MAINLDLVRSKLKELQKSTSKSTLLWKPEPGDNDIRILPYKYRLGNPFLELFFYYPPKPNRPSVCSKTTLSPISFDNPDPIVEFCEELMNAGTKDEWVIGKKLSPNRRTFLPVLVRGKEKEGPKFWGFPDTVFQKLLLLMEDAAPEDITDLRSGRDIVVNLKKASGENSFDQTDVRLKLKTSVATDDADVIAAIKDMSPITDLYPEPSYDSLKQQLDKWLKADTMNDSNDSEVTPVKPTPSVKETSTSSKSDESLLDSDLSGPEIANKVLSDVEAEFDDLFNKV